MKKILLALMLAGCISTMVSAQSTSTYKRKGCHLTFINQAPGLDPALQEKLVNTFFTVYPKLAKAYNTHTAKSVTFVMDTTYNGVAATDNGRVVFSFKYMKSHPKDIDVVTHEVMHIVQDYGDSNGPGWLTEGIADYARNKFGVDNAGAGWCLPDYKPTQNYTNSYRITARFLVWIEEKYKPDMVKELDKAMRDHTYHDDIWKEKTGKSLDELWTAYAQNPVI